MFSIAVVDDEQVHRDILVKYIEEWKKAQGCGRGSEDIPGQRHLLLYMVRRSAV